MTARTYTVTFEDDSRLAYLRWRAGGDGREASWVLRLYGPGHWCVGEGAPYRFGSEADAMATGEIWTATGLQPCEQGRVINANRKELAA